MYTYQSAVCMLYIYKMHLYILHISMYIYICVYLYVFICIYTQNAIVAKNSRHGSQVPVEVSSRRSFRQLGGRIKRVPNLPKFEMNLLVWFCRGH